MNETPTTDQQPTPNKNRKKTIAATTAAILGLACVGTGIYFATNNNNDEENTQTVGEATKDYTTQPDVMTEDNNATVENEEPDTNNQENPNQTDNPDHNPQYNPNENIPTIDDITPESQATTQFGKEHDYNGLKVTVDTPKETQPHLCADVTINNATDQPRDYNNLFFVLTYDGKSTFPELGGKSTLSSGSIEPGKTITGTSCFPNGKEGKISYADPGTSELKTWE